MKQITLKKARRYEKLIAHKDKNVSPYTNFNIYAKNIEEATIREALKNKHLPAFLEMFEKSQKLIRTQYTLRAIIHKANYESGIANEMLNKNLFSAQLALINNLLESIGNSYELEKGTPYTIRKLIEQELNNSTGYGVSSSILGLTLQKENIQDLEEMEQTLKRKIVETSDKIEELNASTYVKLDNELVEFLEELI